jgi:hypothetical protein
MLYEGKAVIVGHSAVFGRLETPVRLVETREPTPYGQYPVSVTIVFKEPRRRKRYSFTAVPDNLKYFTIEANGQVLWDSRSVVPCDMMLWQTTNNRFQGSWTDNHTEEEAVKGKQPMQQLQHRKDARLEDALSQAIDYTERLLDGFGEYGSTGYWNY